MSVFVFSSPICPPCKIMKPIFNELEEEFPSLKFVYVNIREDPQGLKTKYNVKLVPTMVVDSPKGVESHSGTVVMGYYRILRNAN